MILIIKIIILNNTVDLLLIIINLLLNMELISDINIPTMYINKNKFNIPVILDKISNRNPTYRNRGRDIIEHFINDTNNVYFVLKMYSRYKNDLTQTGIELKYINKPI